MYNILSNQVVAWSKAWVSLAGIESSNPVGSMVVSCECCLYTSLRRAEYWCGGFLPNVVCLYAIVKHRLREAPGPLAAVEPWGLTLWLKILPS